METENTYGPKISRRGVLQGAAVVGASFFAATAVPAPAAAAGLTVSRIKVLAGTQSPLQYGVGATDLGIPARTPDGRMLFLFGDTWADTVGGANWRSPVALYSSTTNLKDASHVAQLYGGYIIPGSTLSDLHLSVSQWHTGNNSVYHSEQFRVQGLV